MRGSGRHYKGDGAASTSSAKKKNPGKSCARSTQGGDAIGARKIMAGTRMKRSRSGWLLDDFISRGRRNNAGEWRAMRGCAVGDKT